MTGGAARDPVAKVRRRIAAAVDERPAQRIKRERRRQVRPDLGARRDDTGERQIGRRDVAPR
ncbi:MAG: hypothetical protein U0470_03640 [Anaerolineae bacterium]